MMFTLPKPSGAFRWVQLHAESVGGVYAGPVGDAHSRPALVCDALVPFARHFFTTLAWKLGEPEPTDAGWIEVAHAAGVELSGFRRLRQVHGAAVVVSRKADGRGQRDGGDTCEADIILTDDATQAISVKVADCLPILIVDRRTKAVAAAHAGWRGLAARVPIVTVDRLAAEFGSRASDLLVAIGPSIGACCYEVGEDVRERFSGFRAAEIERWFGGQPSVWTGNPPVARLRSARRPGHWFFDGWQCARDQLLSAGVPSDQVLVAELCTASHGVFCSYRRDGAGATGRMVGVIRTKN